MISLTIDTSDLQTKLAQFGGADLPRDIADTVATDAVMPEGAKYPPQAHRPMKFKSSAQRRKVFRLIKDGKVPYARTGKLGGDVHKQPFGQGVDVQWTAPYAEIVIGEKQDPYFDNWRNVVRLAHDVESDAAELIATAEVIKQLQKAGLT
jgi:hypothetical protein